MDEVETHKNRQVPVESKRDFLTGNWGQRRSSADVPTNLDVKLSRSHSDNEPVPQSKPQRRDETVAADPLNELTLSRRLFLKLAALTGSALALNRSETVHAQNDTVATPEPIPRSPEIPPDRQVDRESVRIISTQNSEVRRIDSLDKPWLSADLPNQFQNALRQRFVDQGLVDEDNLESFELKLEETLETFNSLRTKLLEPLTIGRQSFSYENPKFFLPFVGHIFEMTAYQEKAMFGELEEEYQVKELHLQVLTKIAQDKERSLSERTEDATEQIPESVPIVIGDSEAVTSLLEDQEYLENWMDITLSTIDSFQRLMPIAAPEITTLEISDDLPGRIGGTMSPDTGWMQNQTRGRSWLKVFHHENNHEWDRNHLISHNAETLPDKFANLTLEQIVDYQVQYARTIDALAASLRENLHQPESALMFNMFATRGRLFNEIFIRTNVKVLEHLKEIDPMYEELEMDKTVQVLESKMDEISSARNGEPVIIEISNESALQRSASYIHTFVRNNPDYQNVYLGDPQNNIQLESMVGSINDAVCEHLQHFAVNPTLENSGSFQQIVFPREQPPPLVSGLESLRDLDNFRIQMFGGANISPEATANDVYVRMILEIGSVIGIHDDDMQDVGSIFRWFDTTFEAQEYVDEILEILDRVSDNHQESRQILATFVISKFFDWAHRHVSSMDIDSMSQEIINGLPVVILVEPYISLFADEFQGVYDQLKEKYPSSIDQVVSSPFGVYLEQYLNESGQ